jgi:hypothetical protein
VERDGATLIAGRSILWLAYASAAGSVDPNHDDQMEEIAARASEVRANIGAIEHALRDMRSTAESIGLRTPFAAMAEQVRLFHLAFEQTPWATQKRARRQRGEKKSVSGQRLRIALVETWIDLLRNHDWPGLQDQRTLVPGPRSANVDATDGDRALAAIAIGVDQPCSEPADFDERIEKWRKRRTRSGR